MVTASVEPMTMSALIQSMGSVVTFLIEQVGTVFGIIQTYPIALLAVGISLAFVAVKFAKYVLGL